MAYMKDLIVSIIIIALVVGGLIIGVYFLFNFGGDESDVVSSKKDIEESPPETLNINASNKTKTNKNMVAIMKTNYGDIKLELFVSDAPGTVENFVKLAREGFYNGTKFHRVVKGFMIQGGDPLSKDNSLKDKWGSGGPGYQFSDEIHANNHNVVGTISMANAGPDTNGSQFFINTNNNDFLDTKHTVFGGVIGGMDIVSQIEVVATEESDRPIEDVIIESITIDPSP